MGISDILVGRESNFTHTPVVHRFAPRSHSPSIFPRGPDCDQGSETGKLQVVGCGSRTPTENPVGSPLIHQSSGVSLN